MRPTNPKQVVEQMQVVHHIDGSIRVIVPTRHATLKLSIDSKGMMGGMEFIEHTITEAVARSTKAEIDYTLIGYDDV